MLCGSLQITLVGIEGNNMVTLDFEVELSGKKNRAMNVKNRLRSINKKEESCQLHAQTQCYCRESCRRSSVLERIPDCG